MVKNIYSSKSFLDNLNNADTFTEEDFTEDFKEDLNIMDIVKAGMLETVSVDSDKLSDMDIDDIDRAYNYVYNTDVYNLLADNLIVKIMIIEQSKYNLLNLPSQPTIDDTDFF